MTITYRTGGGSSGTGALSLENNHIFSTTSERDAYFTTNPLELVVDLYSSVNGVLYKYNGTAWKDVSAVIKGADGDAAGAEDINDLNTRTNTLEQHTHQHGNQSILDTTTGVFTSARESKLDNITEIFRGEFLNSVDRDVNIPVPQNGWQCKQTNTGTIWIYAAGGWVDTGSSSTGNMLTSNYDPQGIGADAYDRSNHTGLQLIATIRGLQDALDNLVEKDPFRGLSQEDFTTAKSNQLSWFSRNWSTKVDKVAGKQLSTRDFTDDINNAVIGLRKYNPSPSTYWGTIENANSKIVKTKLLNVTFSQGGDFSVAHGLPDNSEVIGVQCGFRYSGDGSDTRQYMPPNFTDSVKFEYQVYCNSSSVTIRPISASNLYGRSGSVLVTYIE